ncbi:hypothetical protein BDW02DRAFT_569824 [Decorospora gaudefroyi]|uniref:Uncharacterized protein n=1 Tax=Decorospora gaudefroyi TaxID=184978 RepID=A0A6A5KGK2_9PLEO|nr:hypothetical protein BDW02DRAFT_569824 [Decorospora gaudefroyi]
MYNLTARTAPLRTPRILSTTRLFPQTRTYSSGSPTAGDAPPEHFTKTGEKPQDPTSLNSRSYEYSQSGGDDMVAEQENASFTSTDTDPLAQKSTAGKGNVVNPLEFSPATTELSKHFEDNEVTSSEEREAGAKTGKGVSRKSKTVEKTELDFKPTR